MDQDFPLKIYCAAMYTIGRYWKGIFIDPLKSYKLDAFWTGEPPLCVCL